MTKKNKKTIDSSSQEVYNKLGALDKALENAEDII